MKSEKDLNRKTFKIILDKLKEAGYNTVEWVEAELTHRLKYKKSESQ